MLICKPPKISGSIVPIPIAGLGIEMVLGIAAAIFATFAWAMNFVVPFVVGKYTIFDIALLRFSVSALVGAGILVIRRDETLRLSARDWVTASWLAFLGYVGYFLAVAGAAIHAGPI